MKKVLVITYYWPPSGGAGVQRWLKFVKYLRDFGWEPIIYTPENPEVPAIDDSLFKDIPENLTVLKTKVWEPYSSYKRFVGRKKDDSIKAGFLSEKKNPSLTEKISVWIRGNFFIPDARKFWIKPSVKYLIDYLSFNPVDAIVSTGPPHSMHMIALGIKKKLKIPWLADFRDPWTNIDFYDKLMLTAKADKKHRQMEQQVLKTADKLVTVSWNCARDFEKLGADKVEVITNGFDPDDFINLKYKPSVKFEIIHIGSMNKDRNPSVFWEALHELNNEENTFSKDLKLTFVGQTDYSVFEALEKFGITTYAEKINYKPHDELLTSARNASVLLLPLNNTPNVLGIVTGKIFEYLALQKPIFCIGPEEGDCARIIKECNAGLVAGFDDKEKMKSGLLKLYEDYKFGKILKAENDEDIKIYSRQKLTGDMVELLNEMIKKK
ncbi:MAG: glycosyltransferase family 4 protein [Bacteroidales bacterium]|nr:glycosyltransferase family 4 protein [Bacteroidales bacterium]